MPAIPPNDTAVIDEPWDAQAQIDKLPDAMTKALGQAMFAWYDGSAPDTDGDDGWPDAKGAYKFPHHEVSDQGKPGVANLPGCRNGLSRLSSADIPEADRDGVRAHLQHHIDAAPDTSTAAKPDQMDALGEERFGTMLCRNWAIVPDALLELTSRLTPQARVDAAALISAHADPRVGADGTALSAAVQGRSAGTRMATEAGGEIAILPLRGTIRPRGSFLSMLFGGGGGLQGFREAFREALADDNVKAIVIDIDSPGGLIDLVPEASAEIRAGREQKKIVAVANTMAASAAYWLAAQATELVVTPSGQVGSIGVFAIHEDFSKMEQMMGIATTIISAGPYKTDGNPYEPLSKSAQAALQDQVDQLYAMFTADVAAGRGVKPEAVAAGYGSGRLLLAGDALAVGMVDRIEALEDTLARLGGTPDEEDDNAPDDDEDDDLDLVVEAAAAAATTTDERDTVTSARATTDYLSPQSALREQSYL
jgi:signal peptide peptidase SppA